MSKCVFFFPIHIKSMFKKDEKEMDGPADKGGKEYPSTTCLIHDVEMSYSEYKTSTRHNRSLKSLLRT